MILTQAWKQFFKTKITLHSKILTDFHGFAEKINLAATGTDHQQLIHNTAFNLFALVNEENHQVSFCHHTTQPLQAPTGMTQMHCMWRWLVLDPLPHPSCSMVPKLTKTSRSKCHASRRTKTSPWPPPRTWRASSRRKLDPASSSPSHTWPRFPPSFSTCSQDRHLTILQIYISPQNKQQSNSASPRPTW